jgi:hypothetical protein
MANQTRNTIQMYRTDVSMQVGSLGADAEETAQRHLAELRTHHPAQPAEARTLSKPAARRFGRRLARERERVSIRLEGLRRAWEAPHHRLGWWVAHARLWGRPTVGMPTIFALAVLAIVGVLAFGYVPFVHLGASKPLKDLFFGATLTAAIVALWGDLFRLPYQSWRIRQRIAKSPWCVLPTTSRKRRAELMARDETTLMVPRQELYDELLPGILDSSQRDTQMVVGEPGAGKTTALVGISRLLARIGIVPVVVPLWGKMPENLVDEARKRFKQHTRSLLRSEARLDELWRWLCEHRRVVILVDDLDRIGPDGDRGFLLRRALEELAGEGLPAVVTTRPAGIPAGLATSAISLENLDEEAAVNHVLRVAREQPGTIARAFDGSKVSGKVALWVKEGKMAEVPFYLELLARLVAARRCDELAPASSLVAEGEKGGRVRIRADGRCEWNPLWVRFRLLERFYNEVAAGTVYQWLGIDALEREKCLKALSEAALAQLAATALKALPQAEEEHGWSVVREDIEQFLDTDDRSSLDYGQRKTVSAHEVVNTAERLRMLDRDPEGKLHFNHRILQAYLAGRLLAEKLAVKLEGNLEWGRWPDDEDHPLDWLGALLDPHHPERMTANMTLMFAALRAVRSGSPAARGNGAANGADEIGALLQRLVDEAGDKLPRPSDDSQAAQEEQEEVQNRRRDRRLDPRKTFDPERNRADPDDALAKLTTAAEIAAATGEPGQAPKKILDEILDGVRAAPGATRLTKLNAIPAIAALNGADSEHWTRIWEFARDPDQAVRRAASEAIADDAFSAYRALQAGIEALLTQAALKSAHDLPLDALSDDAQKDAAGFGGEAYAERLASYGIEREKDEVLSLRALGWVLPAIVSGLREDPKRQAEQGLRPRQDEDGDRRKERSGGNPAEEQYEDCVRRARRSLERLVTLAFQRKFPELEASVAQGFKSDAMRHADDPEHPSGPGLVASNRQLVSDICIDNAHHWYARMVLHQALALYTVAGSDAALAFGTYGRVLHRGGEPHPFVSRAAQQARRAISRYLIGSDGWKAFVWADEGDAASRRQAGLNPTAAQLVGDVTLLLNLNERAPEDRQAQFARMNELPHCLRRSTERLEILGAGCSEHCGYGLCPLKEAPVDEPDGQRTISRAFCRGQQRVAARRVPPWQHRIRRRALKEFWREMERRART